MFYENHRGEYSYRASAAPFGRSVAADDEPLEVPTPRVARKVPGPGNWRTDRARRPKPRKKLMVRPTGGGCDRPKVMPTRKRRKTPKSVGPSAASLHAAWARHENVI